MKTVTRKSVGVIIFACFPRSLKYLLIKQHQGHWGFPKGHTEKGEKYIDTALRELKEETGIKKIRFTEKKILFNDYYLIRYENMNINKYVHYYVAESFGTDVKIDGREIINYAWCTYPKAADKLTFKNSKDILKKVNKYITEYLKYE